MRYVSCLTSSDIPLSLNIRIEVLYRDSKQCRDGVRTDLKEVFNQHHQLKFNLPGPPKGRGLRTSHSKPPLIARRRRGKGLQSWQACDDQTRLEQRDEFVLTYQFFRGKGRVIADHLIHRNTNWKCNSFFYSHSIDFVFVKFAGLIFNYSCSKLKKTFDITLKAEKQEHKGCQKDRLPDRGQ